MPISALKVLKPYLFVNINFSKTLPFISTQPILSLPFPARLQGIKINKPSANVATELASLRTRTPIQAIPSPMPRALCPTPIVPQPKGPCTLSPSLLSSPAALLSA